MIELTPQELLERRYGPDTVQAQSQIYRDNVVKAEAQERSNIRVQFQDALNAVARASAEAYNGASGNMWLRYVRAYDNLYQLAQTVATYGDDVEIPARLPEKGAAGTVTIKAPVWAKAGR